MSIQPGMEAKLRDAFQVTHLSVENESHQHSVPKHSETHFKVVLVSDDFEGKGKVARHQAVYRVLQAELQAGVHALALHVYTEREWAARHASAPASPTCMGGSRHEHAS